MQKLIFTTLLLGVQLFFHSFLFSQGNIPVNFPIQEVEYSSISHLGEPQIEAREFKIFKIEISTLWSQLEGVKSTLSESEGFTAIVKLPHPNGDIEDYNVVLNTTMSEGLQNKFPNIRSYDAYNSTSGNKVKLDLTNQGLRAMIFTTSDGIYFMDPVFKGNTTYYMVYRKKDFSTSKMKECLFQGNNLDKNPSNGGTVKSFVTCDLRTYDLAVSATVEYSDFHGGTVPDALSAQVTTMNRVNGVFERDLAVTMSLVPNNDQIIYTGNPNLDPFSNGNPGNMINENQSVCDNEIGSANYDIGHVFGTNSGGLAGLGVICFGGQKARGVTGSAAPIGDPFDIDYVAHEIGHQFGANHTQNNGCNRNNATAMEPGSASTIMGYAGICAPNIQSNSDDHFHGISLEEMSNRILSTSCATITAISNNAPVIQSTNGNVTVPAGTPFALTANTTDVDGDVLQYCWEQMDNEVSTQPPASTSTGGPNFRSNSPVTDPTRYFPNLVDLAAGGPFTWEVVPSVSRTMDFRVTVRDKPLGVAGCNDYEDVTVTTDDGSGPFVVTYPSATGIVWNASTTETVTWDVANTDVAPVSCSNVDVYLSTDGGVTYPTLLADDVPNTGSANVTVPNIGTTTARVMVISSTGTFFDISDNNFEIVEVLSDYTLAVSPSTIEVCQPNTSEYTIDIGSVSGYNDPVSLSVTGVPAGATSNFSVNPVTPVGTSILTIDDTDLATPGTYNLTVEANSTSGIKSEDITILIKQSYNQTDAATICDGDTYSFGTQTLTSAGTYTEVFTSANGCDSTVMLTLNVNPVYNENIEAAICDGDTYNFGTQSLTSSGTYTEPFTSVDGCDSTVILTLNVNPVYNESDAATICDGDTYTFGTQTLTTSGTYTEAFTSVGGCDSTVILTLNVNPVYNESDAATICDGDTYNFGTQSLTSSGTYTETFTSVDGCDSTVILNLTVHESYNEEVDASICEGEVYTFPDGTTGISDQIQSSVLTSVNGCDSVIVTNLTVETLDLSVTQTGSTLTANQTGAAYQWMDCNNDESIIGETGISYTVSSTGNYAVIITSGSCSDTSDCYLVDLTGLETFNPENLIVYPNPTNGKVNLKWSGKVEQIEVYDAVGRLIIKTDKYLKNETTLNISDVESGVYYIRVYYNNGIHNVEIVKN